MKRIIQITIAAFLFWSCSPNEQFETKTAKVSSLESLETENKINNLLAQMTLKEKAGQMLNIGLPAILVGEYWDKRDSAVF